MCRLLLKVLLLLLLALPAIANIDQASAGAEASIQLPPPKAGRTRSLVAIAADNAGTETTDLIVPYGVLKAAGVADVVIVSTHPGVVGLMPALAIEPDTTMSEFDAASPSGADIVIVPAMHDSGNKAVISWVQEQSAKGAIVVSICEGAWISARAGILEGKVATTHWYAFDDLANAFPTTRWVRDQRYVFDRNVLTTTGVTASIPASLALVEAIAGRAKASAAAAQLGVADWTAVHDSGPFRLTAGRIWQIGSNFLAFWGHETLQVPVEAGFDEIALALTADAWSRTYRSHAVAVGKSGPIRSRHSLMLVPDRNAASACPDISIPQTASARALDHALAEIAARYGSSTAGIVALQLEYPTRQAGAY
ncbi:putative intracellular protease/amidase [Mesorhizobium soli]|uniref:DJ-1/PfpI family protein n=1 Tax=Pseudaminobacter soli (ex Li et al. 2025) TaxID=1295366 RepID=UPI0024768D12|nr:DJ-1/PfpI family protein [Mesorhizobium soli]MDH6230481.1 putative intracellular protease/amidase [Mesorhizobium soli]